MTTSHNPQPSTALIAGCGYLGLRVARRWRAAGGAVYAITRCTQKAEKLKSLGICPLLLDLSRDQPLLQLPRTHTVLWAVGFERQSNVPREQIWINGLTRLVRGLPQSPSPQRLIYISSTSVYGDAGGDQVNERDTPSPVTEGGAACWQAEQHLHQLLGDRGTQLIVLRLAGIYGPDRLLRRMADLKNGTPLTGPADDWLNLIHVDDAAAMVEWAATASQVPSLLNVANSQTLTRREYYMLLAELAGATPPQFTDVQDTPGGRRRSGNKRVLSSLRAGLGVTFRYDDVRQGLRQAVANSAADGP